MELTKDQKDFYETTRTRCRDEVTQINGTIKTEYTRLTEEIKRVNDLIATLEGRKQVIGQMYGSASEMIGQILHGEERRGAALAVHEVVRVLLAAMAADELALPLAGHEPQVEDARHEGEQRHLRAAREHVAVPGRRLRRRLLLELQRRLGHG